MGLNIREYDVTNHRNNSLQKPRAVRVDADRISMSTYLLTSNTGLQIFLTCLSSSSVPIFICHVFVDRLCSDSTFQTSSKNNSSVILYRATVTRKSHTSAPTFFLIFTSRPAFSVLLAHFVHHLADLHESSFFKISKAHRLYPTNISNILSLQSRTESFLNPVTLLNIPYCFPFRFLFRERQSIFPD